MVNITILNNDFHIEENGDLLTSDVRRGPSGDWTGCEVLCGVQKLTVSATWTGETVSAYVTLRLWACGEYIYDDVILLNENLNENRVFEDIKISEDNYCEIDLYCDRGYITNYKLELEITYENWDA